MTNEDKPNRLIDDNYYDSMKKLVYEMPFTYATILSTFPEGRTALRKECEVMELDQEIELKQLSDRAAIEKERDP